jgi:RND family efflux transporter MFP subunit
MNPYTGAFFGGVSRSVIATYKWVLAHKFTSLLLALALAGGGWWAYTTFVGVETETRYVLGTVERGTIVQTISASGQVSASNQVDIKPRVSGDVTWVALKAGAKVRQGQVIATVDSTDAKQDIADAEQELAQSKLQYQKDSAQAPMDYEQAEEALADAHEDLVTTYSDAYNTVSDTYLALPAVMTGLQGVLFGYDLSTSRSQWNADVFSSMFSNSETDSATMQTLVQKAKNDYEIARSGYDTSLDGYKKLTRSSSTEDIETALDRAVDSTTGISQALQSALNVIDAAIDIAEQRYATLGSSVSTLRTNAQTHLSTTNAKLSALLAQQSELGTAQRAIRDQERDIQILKIGNPTGADPISLQASRNDIADQERKLMELRNDLADYTITAPFSGTLATVDIESYDSVTTGTSVATLITDQKIAELSLNEVDMAAVKVGNKATLTFDAVEDLTLTGSVIEIDAVGTVSQGVVSYNVKIGFDARDERIKPGMTVNASIMTEVREDVLLVPASAVKAQAAASYVLAFTPELTDTGGPQGVTSATVPSRVPVEIGISDDAHVEIVSGLSEGQQVVVKTTTSVINESSSTAGTQRVSAPNGGTMIRF